MKIALAQTNPTIGDLKANSAGIILRIQQAAQAGAQLVVFPELSLIGYPPKDLLLKPRFINDNITALENIAQHCQNIAAVVGFACPHTGTGRTLHNAAALLQNKQVVATYYKQLLPTYDVFDESRYFEPAQSQSVIEFQGRRIGLTICEDIWNEPRPTQRPLYHAQPFAQLAQARVDLVINMSASPFVIGKHQFRLDLFAQQCRKHQLPLIYVNQVGGNDELVFDGNSCAFTNTGHLVAQAKDFQEDLLIVDLDNPDPHCNRVENPLQDVASVHAALVLGLRDYVQKCKFKSVVLGLSGGIDSALTAAIAAEALGPKNVLGVAMPSRYSSPHSVADARQLAQNLKINYHEIPIEPAHAALEQMLDPIFQNLPPDITEENLQARVRANILMALSNKFGHLLLTTGNKSELAVGYCTMYGDMAGGLAVISDVPKTLVYKISKYINRNSEIIPDSTITKPPSAELRPDQLDSDSLPPYDTLDQILQLYVEQEQSQDEIIAQGFDHQTVKRIITLVDRNEYKRKQAAPGLKVTSRAFGFGRRMPIAQNYHPT
ncbi:MAG: NAD+ synthase [Sedimentisphaerales bacterium]|nr:NAD+ synthase [Sedimentisphaerales bacterium]